MQPLMMPTDKCVESDTSHFQNHSSLGYFAASRVTKMPLSNLEVLGFDPNQNFLCLLQNILTSKVQSLGV